MVCLTEVLLPEQEEKYKEPVDGVPAIAGIVTHEARKGALFPWQQRQRWRKWAFLRPNSTMIGWPGRWMPFSPTVARSGKRSDAEP